MTTNTAVLESRLCEADPESMADLLNLLVTVYSDTKVAVVREYVANAIDAQKAAGVDVPVEVTLPNLLNPVLSVRDHGVGLSRDDIVTVYGKFGTSTKRGDTDMIGAFGIGSKTAYAVCSQFQVVGVKDGFATRVLFSRDSNGAPTYTLVSHEPTNEPNGVEVRIFADPNDNASWAKAARAACEVIVGGLVELDGVVVTPAVGEHSLLCEGLHTLERDATGTKQIRALMGNIAYDLPDDLSATLRRELFGKRGLHYSTMLLLEVDNKSLDIASSREAVRDTPRTRRALMQAARRVVASIEADVERATAGMVLPGDIVLSYANIPRRERDSRTFDDLASNAGVYPRSGADNKMTLPTKNLRARRSSWSDRPDVSEREIMLDKPLVVCCPGDKLNRLRRDLSATTLTDGYGWLMVVESESGSNQWFSWGDGAAMPMLTVEQVAADAKTVRANRPKVERKPAEPKPKRTFHVQTPGRNFAHLTADDIVAFGLPVVNGVNYVVSSALADRVVVLCGNAFELRAASKELDVMARSEAARLVCEPCRASVEPDVWFDAVKLCSTELDKGIDQARQAGFSRAEQVLCAWRDRVAVVDVEFAKIARQFGPTAEDSPVDRLPRLFRSMGFSGDALEVLNMLDPAPLMPPAHA